MSPFPTTGYTPIGKQLYDALQPLAYGDSDANGWALFHFADAFMHAAQQAETYARPWYRPEGFDGVMGYAPPWALSVMADYCESEQLDWLGQFVGIDKQEVQPQAYTLGENLVPNPNFNHDALAGLPAKWAKSNVEKYEVSAGWAGHPQALFVETKPVIAVNKFAFIRTEGLGKVTGTPGYMPVLEGEIYYLMAELNVTEYVGPMPVELAVEWFDINGNSLGEEVSAKIEKVEAKNLLVSVKAPVGAAVARCLVQAKTGIANAHVKYYVDNFAFLPTLFNTEYSDGDSPGWQWTGTPGASPSRRQELEGPNEVEARKRKLIKEQPATKRGTPEAIENVVKQYLTGNKNIVMIERDGGAYKLTISVYENQVTDQVGLEKALSAYGSVIPGGIKLTLEFATGTTYTIVKTSYPSYTELLAKYLTYRGLAKGLPGT